jgi:hypothetical protein
VRPGNRSKSPATETGLIHFVKYGNNTPQDHPTGTQCRPGFVAIRMPQASSPAAPDVITLEEHVVPSKTPKPNTKLAWSQLEATGEILSKGKTLAESQAQAAAYTLYQLQARPDLISVLGIFVHPEKCEFGLYLTHARWVYHAPIVSYKDPKALPLLVSWVRRLYQPERSRDIQRVGSYPDKPTFTIAAGYPKDFEGCGIISVGFGRRRPTIFANPEVVIKSQNFVIGRRFEEDKILRVIHDGGCAEFPGVVRVLEGGSNELASGGTFVEGVIEGEATDDGEATDEEGATDGEGSTDEEWGTDGEGPTDEEGATDEGWLDHLRGNKETRQTLLVLKDNVRMPFMDVETPLDALVAIYDLLEGNVLSLFLVQTLIP